MDSATFHQHWYSHEKGIQTNNAIKTKSTATDALTLLNIDNDLTHMAAVDPELQAVESALNTLALAESEKALQKVVNRLLPALLSALSTKSSAARAKCIETLQHINVRVRATPSLTLPFDDVLSVCTQPDAAIFTVTVGIQGGYLARCFDRLTNEQRAKKFPMLAKAAVLVKSPANRDIIHFLCIRALTALSASSDKRKDDVKDGQQGRLWTVLKDTCSEFAVNVFFDFCLRALRKKLSSTNMNISEDAMIAIIRIVSEYAGVKQYERAAKVYTHILIAAGMSSRSNVQEVGEHALKNIDNADLLVEADPTLINRLFDIFIDPLTELQQRIIIMSKGLLNISLCASCFPEVLDVIQLSLRTHGIPKRFQSLGMQFVSFVIKFAEIDVLKQNAEVLVNGMLELANNITFGSPSFPDTVRGFGFTAIGQLVVRLPHLMSDGGDKRITSEFFFSAAQSEDLPIAVRSSAAHTLISVARVLKFDNASADVRDKVISTLIGALENRGDAATSARAAAVYWANECFAFTDCKARLLNIIAAADVKQDVRQNALAGLSPKRWSFRDGSILDSKEIKDDDNDEAMKDVEKVHDDVMGVNSRPSVTEMVKVATEYGIRRHPLMIEAYLAFTFYLIRHSVVNNGKLEVVNIDSADRYFNQHDNDRRALEKMCELADDVLFERVNTVASSTPIVSSVSSSISTSSNLEKAAMSVCVFASKISSLRQGCANRYAKRVTELLALACRKMASGDIVGARAIAGLVGCACADAEYGMKDEEIEQLLKKIVKILQPNDNGIASARSGEDERAAHILCLAQIIVHSRRRRRLNVFEFSTVSDACMSMTRRLSMAVESTNVVRMAVCIGISDICATGPLPVDFNARDILIGSLSGLLKAHSTNAKLAQLAADAIGNVCIGEPRKSFRKKSIDVLLQICKERKEDEIRFVAAESLVRCASGFDAPSPTATEQLEGGENGSGTGNKSRKKKNSVGDGGNGGNGNGTDEETIAETLQGVLQMRTEPFDVKMVLKEEGESGERIDDDNDDLMTAIKGSIALSYDERPTARAGGCVCLVTFLRLLGRKQRDDNDDEGGFKMEFRTPEDEARFKSKQTCVQNLLEDIQKAFTILLGDQSEFVQQLSSCGVALAYQMCPPDQQNELVSALVRSLTAGKAKSAATVPGDEGTLLELGTTDTKDKNSVVPKSGTYKELCTLAQDMGQPELVYKFMDLAGHAALWNNRKGAALAGSALLGGKVAAEQLKPHVTKLLPRLYVYCYDPTEGVRTSMASVLSAVIRAAGLGSVYEAVTVHFDAVVSHCLKSMTSRQWRAREAGCGALRDALASSRTWDLVSEHVKDFWYHTLRVMDDIKETVRKAAQGTLRSLSELSVHLCDSGQVGVDVAREASIIVISAVMQGVMHSDAGIRSACGSTMTKLIRYGGEALRPSVPRLMGMLLEAATEMDDAPQLNYVGFHVSAEERQALEDARVSMASSSNASPLVDSLERLAGLVDESNAEDSVRQVARMAKVGVGIPTRAATARVFGSLVRGRAIVVKPFANRLMNAAGLACAMEAGSATALRAAWGRAAGSAARLCEVEDVWKFVKGIAELAGGDDEKGRAQASFLAVGLWRESAETARQHAGALLPLAYMGSQEVDDSEVGDNDGGDGGGVSVVARKNWKEVWDEGAGSEEAALRHYAKEITEICEKRMKESGQYRVKRSAAKSLGAVAGAWREGSDTEYVKRGVMALMEVLPGHMWDGKIVVVEAVTTAARRCGNVENFWGGENAVQKVISLLIVEAKRGKSEYRVAAMEAMKELVKGCRQGEGNNKAVNLFDDVYYGVEEYWKAFSTVGVDENSSEMDVDVGRTVWETGSDVNAVDARNRMRKAKRMLCVAAVNCIEGCFDGRSVEQFERIVSIVESIVKSDWEVRMTTLKCVKECGGRWKWDTTSNIGHDGNDDYKKIERRLMMNVVAFGMEDGKYAAVRKMAMECFLCVNGGKWLLLSDSGGDEEEERKKMKAMILKCSRDDIDYAAQMAAKKICTALELQL